MKPQEVRWAETVLGIAKRFGALPSAVLEEDAALLRMLNLVDPDCGSAKD